MDRHLWVPKSFLIKIYNYLRKKVYGLRTPSSGIKNDLNQIKTQLSKKFTIFKQI